MKIAFIIILLFLPCVVSAESPAVTNAGVIEKARDLLKASKPEDALSILSSYQPVAQEFSLYHALYAQALVQTKRLNESIVYYRIAYIYAATAAEKERMLFERAETYRKMDYYSEAAVCYRNFLKHYPQSTFGTRAQLGLADASYRSGRFHESVEAYERSGDTFEALSGKANALHALGMFQEANELYTALIKRDKKYVEASQETLYNIGENFRELGRFLDAKIYLNSIKDRGLQPRAYIGLGLIAQKEKKYTAAMKLFTEALNAQDRKLRRRALLYLAETSLAWGKQDEALPRLIEIRKDYPYGKEYDTALLLLARLYRSRGKPAASVPLLNELVCRKAPMPEALEELESMMVELKGKDNAELAKIWSVAGHWLLDPTRIPAIVKIARALRHSGKPYLDIARWLIKNGSEEAKAQGRLLLADFYADIGEAATASQYAHRARKTLREDDTLRTQARVFFVNGAYQEAVGALLNIKEVSEPDILLILDAARSLKDPGKALVFCEDLFSKNSWSPTAQVLFADFLYDNGRKQDALKYYTAVASLKPESFRNASALADIEWACYRVSLLAPGKDAVDALARIQRAKSALGRFAGADLKGMTITERIP